MLIFKCLYDLFSKWFTINQILLYWRTLLSSLELVDTPHYLLRTGCLSVESYIFNCLIKTDWCDTLTEHNNTLFIANCHYVTFKKVLQLRPSQNPTLLCYTICDVQFNIYFQDEFRLPVINIHCVMCNRKANNYSESLYLLFLSYSSIRSY